MTSESDSVFSDGSVLRSTSEYDREDIHDDPLEEYETQYFGFTPKSFMNGVYNALAEYIKEGLTAFTEHIEQQYPEEMTPDDLKKAEENLMKYILRKLNRSFDILEQYLITNVLKIPDHIVLPSDKIQMEHQYTIEDEQQVDMEIQQLKDQILSIRYANGVLRQDMLQIDKVQGIFNTTVKQLEPVEALTKEQGISDIKDNTVYTINQVKKMMNIVKNIEHREKT